MQSSLSPLDQALEALPHGEAFRFIDSLTHLEPGVTGTGSYQFTGKEPFMQAHFPGNPIMPAVLMVEAVAQLGGVIAQSDPRSAALSDLRLTAMKNVKVFGSASPGDVLRIRARVAGRLGNLVQLEGQIECDNTTLLAAQITLSGQLNDTSA